MKLLMWIVGWALFAIGGISILAALLENKSPFPLIELILFILGFLVLVVSCLISTKYKAPKQKKENISSKAPFNRVCH